VRWKFQIGQIPKISVDGFNFLFDDHSKYVEQGRNLEQRGIILNFLQKMPNEDTFIQWCIMNWEVRGISLNSYWGLGSQSVFLLFNSKAMGRSILRFRMWILLGL
jgi:hypothetical protein